MRLTLELIAMNRRLRDAMMVVTSGLVVLLYLAVGDGGFPLDDSWIHQVYARNLAQQGEWAFIPGEPSGASTSPLYTLVLSVGYVVNLDYALWTHFCGFLALAGAGLVAVRMADIVLPTVLIPSWLAGWATVLAWHLIWAAVSGMETMLFCTLVLAMVYMAWREITPLSSDQRHVLLRGVGFGLLAAALIATRPEGALVAFLAGLLMLVAKRDRVEILRLAGGAAGAFALGILPYLLLNLSLNDSLLPNTSAAKQAQHAPLLDNPFLDRWVDMMLPILAGVQLFLLPGAIIFAIWALVGFANGERYMALYTLPILWAFALITLYALRLPASYQHGRYVIPALPPLIVAGTIGTAKFIVWWRNIPGARMLPLTLAFTAALLALYFGFAQGPLIYRTDQRVINDEMVSQAMWIRDNIPPDELLAVHDIGALGYFAPRPIVDIAGLVTPEVIDAIGDAEALWALIEARNAQYLMAFPDQIPNQNPDDPRLCFLHESDGTGSTDIGGPKMTLYRLDFNNSCDNS